MVLPLSRTVRVIVPRVGRQLQRFLTPSAQVGSRVVLPVGVGAIGVGLGLEAGAGAVRRAGQSLGFISQTGLEQAEEQLRTVEVLSSARELERASRLDVPFSPIIITPPQSNVADREGVAPRIDTNTLILAGLIIAGVFLIRRKK